LALSARARLAGLSGGLTVVAVLLAVLPFLAQGALEANQIQRDQLGAVLVGGAEVAPEALVQLHSRAGLSGLVHIDAQGARRDLGGPAAALSQLVERCPDVVGARPVDLAPVDLAEGRLIGSCVGRSDGGRVVAALLVPTWSSSGRTRQILGLALVFGLLAGGLTAGAVRSLLEPLAGMAEAARGLAAGQPLEIELPEDAELLPVAQALHQLAAAQRVREDEIQVRLALTQELAAVVAHEVRNPLQSLTMLADVVAHEPDEQARRDTLAAIQQELALIEVVVRRLVDSGGDLKLVVRPQNLGALLQRCRRLHAPLAREGQVELQVDEVDAPVQVDGALLRRAVENLLHNAIALLAAEGGGRVHLHVERADEHWRIHVDDDGQGVPEDQRERVFEAGVTDRPGGSGLGLALARRVAQAHGGSLAVQSSPMGGARFTLSLPVEAS
jgi:signal transduction histidine kinase